LARLAPATLPRLTDVRVDWTVAGFTVLLCVAIAALFGLAPAQCRRARLRAPTRSASCGTT